MEEVLKSHFGFTDIRLKKLNGYENCNYLLESKGVKYIFKTYQYEEEMYDLVRAQNEALLHLQASPNNKYPKPVKFQSGAYLETVNIEGQATICRLLTFLDGVFAADIDRDAKYLDSFGTFLAETNLKLQSLKDYVIKSRVFEWDLQHFLLNRAYIEDIEDRTKRKVVKYFFMQYEEKVLPLLPSLRKQVIHNDANEWNVLTTDGVVSSLIDFGDIAYTPLINELSIALAYVCYDTKHPLQDAGQVLAAYHKIIPLAEQEVDILYHLIAARLCTSALQSAQSQKRDPDNLYASSSEDKAWSCLGRWLKINPICAKNHFRNAIDLEVPETRDISKTLARRHQHISDLLSISYVQPIHMSQSIFQYMYDTDGNTFLDAYNNIPHVGHSHPKVVAAGRKQMAQLNTNTRYLYDLLPEYAEKLLAKFPASLNKVFFVNSGSAASDLAIRMARAHTGREDIMVLEQGYHGNTQIGIDISDYKFNNPKGTGQKEYILKTPLPNTYNSKYSGELASDLYARDAILQIQSLKNSIAAFIAEPIVGCAGQVPLAKGYLKQVYPAIRQQGGICISDEVQTGFGRLGSHYWGFEMHEVLPDMVILGKPIGNGHPMAAVVTTDEIAASFAKGVEFFSSFGGNPVSCAIGISVLEVIEEEGLQENARVVGELIKNLMTDLQVTYPCIGDIRGSGLFLGFEMINPETNAPAPQLAHFIKNELRKKHILISTDGPYDSVLKMKPSLCFSKENAHELIAAMEEVLSRYTP